MSPGAASGMIARYMKRIEITGGRRAFHALRRTFGTRLLQGETSLDMIQQLLGQKSMNSMKPYLSIDEQGLKQCALPLIKQGKVER
jgi:integrase